MRRMMLVIWLALAAVAAWSAHAAGQGTAGNRVTAYQGPRGIVGDGRAPLENATFIVDGGRFARVARTGEVPIPQGAARSTPPATR